MEALVPFGGLAVGVACSLAAVGVAGLFGRDADDGDGDLDRVARRLDARDDPDAILRRLDALESAVDDLVGDADLNRHVRDPPAADASSVEKVEALSRAVGRDRLSIRPPRTGGSGDGGEVASAAARLRRERSPSSPAARRLLDAAAAPDRADPDEIEAALDRAVSAFDTLHALERAVEELPDAGEVAPNDARRAGDRLDRSDAAVAAGVRRLAEAAEAGHSAAERRESEHGRIADATDAITAAATEAADLDVGPDSGRPAAERLRVLADAVERDELGFAEGGADRVRPVATEVRRERSPESAVAKRLLDRLASPGMGDLRAALDTAVEQLDAASTTQSVVADLDRESVADLADDVAARLDGATGPAADALADRVADLRGMVDRADDSNAVIPYAVRNELRFYDRTLIDELAAASAGASGGAAGTGGGNDLPVAEVADRREAFEDRYVDGRRDHNHSIPLHFLSLVDALREDAEAAAAAGDDARAAGLLAAADETLDYVEKLYERNEYSVMLRRLRG